MAVASSYVTRVLLACLYCGLTAAPAASGQGLEELRAGLRARAQALNHLKVDFDWDLYHVKIKDDPADRTKWFGRFHYDCQIWIIRPDFRWFMIGGWPFDGGMTTSWVDSKMTKVDFDPREGVWGVLIDNNNYESHGPMPVLTPFEMQFCDIQESWLEIVEDGFFDAKSVRHDRVIIAGRPEWRGAPSVWSVRMVLDPTRGWLPVELSAEVPRNDGSNKNIVWNMRTLRSRPVRGVDAIEEAVFTMSNGVTGVWQIYHYVAKSIVVDDTLTKDDLQVGIPRENLRLLDRTTGLVLDTDADGEVIHRRVKTPQEVVDDQLAMAAAFDAQEQARIELAQRKRVFTGTVAAGAVVTVLAAGGWLWRRRALRAA